MMEVQCNGPSSAVCGAECIAVQTTPHSDDLTAFFSIIIIFTSYPPLMYTVHCTVHQSVTLLVELMERRPLPISDDLTASF